MPSIAHPSQLPEPSPLNLTVPPAEGPLFQGPDLDYLRAYLKLEPGQAIDPKLLAIKAPKHPAALGVQAWRVEEDHLLLDDETVAAIQQEQVELERLTAEHQEARSRDMAAFDDWLSMTVAASNQGIGDDEEAAWKEIGAEYDATQAAVAALWSAMEGIWDRQQRRRQLALFLRYRHLLFVVRLFGWIMLAGERHADAEAVGATAQPEYRLGGYRVTITKRLQGKLYDAELPALPGITARGASPDAALRRLEPLVRGYLAALEATQQPLPARDAKESRHAR